jgi:sigma-E factor negative regulatory protein RseB
MTESGPQRLSLQPFAMVVGVMLLGLVSGAFALDAHQWWVAMNDALVHQSYQVDVLHQSNGRVDRVKIWHRVKDGRIEEHLVHSTPHGREVLRSGNGVKVILPAQRLVWVQDQVATPLLNGVPALTPTVDKFYQVELLNDKPMVFGRPCVVLSIRPKDGYRFGYRLTIDAHNQLPVKSELLDLDGNTLEQWLFTDIQTNAALIEQGLKPLQDVSGFSERVPSQTEVAVKPAFHNTEAIAKLPPGFTLTQVLATQPSGSGVRLAVSDGVATVSVFLEAVPAGPWLQQQSEGQVGAARVLSQQWNDHKLTVVGEVPRATIHSVATAIRENEALWKSLVESTQ